MPYAKLMTKNVESFREVRVTSIIKLRVRLTRSNNILNIIIIEPVWLEYEDSMMSRSVGLNGNKEGRDQKSL